MRALLSVFDKTGLIPFAQRLRDLGFELVSTGGTFTALTDAGLNVTAVSELTGFPEILDGRVKTLHPAIHGGLLARHDDAHHMRQLDDHGIVQFDLLVGNLYPFESTISTPGVSFHEAVEQIDIGGPAMLRAAAKNFASIIAVSDPGDYDEIIDCLRLGTVSVEKRRALAAKAYGHVSAYDSLIAEYLRLDQARAFPSEITFAGRKLQDLRYGENPSQQAAAYRRLSASPSPSGILSARQLSGKKLSFNNLLDADAAWGAVQGFEEPTVAIVKHTMPCGLATRSALTDAFTAAFAGDPVSAFGGIVALNREMDGETAGKVAETFFEVIIAPGFTESAREALRRKSSLRLLELPDAAGPADGARPLDIRLIAGGFLIQEPDDRHDDPAQWQTVTRRTPSDTELRDLCFAWNAARHVRSNAIVMAKDNAIVGVGGGQPNRLESVSIAARKAGERAHGASLASDAFFPFPDGVEAAAMAGVSAIVQPGGSVRDAEVITAAEDAGIAMLFTGTRHFRH
jgi:phosphoribosylaminoimidazolecarboxamide formyltransferase/IMP cyclohydrolase